MGSEVARVKSLPELGSLSPRERERAFARIYWPRLHRALAARFGQRPELVNAASAMVRHCAAETGYGAQLYNWNCGFYVWVGDSADRFAFTDDAPLYDDAGNYQGQTARHKVYFEAPHSIDEGIARYCAIVLRSPTRKSVLLSNPIDYFVALRVTGYLGGHGESDELLRAAMVQGISQVNSDTADLQPSTRRTFLGVSILGSAALLTTTYLAT